MRATLGQGRGHKGKHEGIIGTSRHLKVPFFILRDYLYTIIHRYIR